MNNSLKIALVLSGFVLIAVACNKERLEVDPVNQFLSSNYYETEEQIYSTLIGAYDPIGWSMAFGQWISPVMFGEIRSDNANAGGDPSNNDQPGWQEFDDFTNTNTNLVVHPMYRRNYIGINRANSLLALARLESDLVDVYKAEAKFFTGLLSFRVVSSFRDPFQLLRSL